MLVYKNTFENIRRMNCNFPVEDQYYASDNEAIVADGITRDPIGVDKLSAFSSEEKIRRYPRPSGAELAAKTICHTFPRTTGTLKERLIECNKAIKLLNDKYVEQCDYLQNDYYGAVASCMHMENSVMEYAYICDCGIIVYDTAGKVKFQTEDDKELYSDPYIERALLESPWDLPEGRAIVRRDFRNRINNIQNGSCVSYGALTGEKVAEYFIKSGKIELSRGDVIGIYSDGFKNFLHDEEFIKLVINFEKERLEKYVKVMSEKDYKKYGGEKTIVVNEKDDLER